MSFKVQTNNNLLTYVMMILNLDATGHRWVRSLASLNFELEYQKSQDNMVADILSQITTWLTLEAVKSILDGVTLGSVR